MRAAPFVASLLALTACKVKDPLFCDENHPCTDPSRPYCDLTAEYPASENIAKTCIPSPFDAGPICTPDVADRCDGDTVHRCNSTGTGFESVQCTLGCDTTIPGGCRLCMPNQTACTNGTLATCDGSGNIVSMRACALGCFQNEPRCTDVDPSNGLATYLDMTTTVGVDLDLKDGAVINTADGSIVDGDGKALTVPSTLVSAPPNGVAIRVFIVKSAHLRGTTFPSAAVASPAFALVSDGPILVDGLLDLTSAYAPGSLLFGACAGQAGGTDQFNNHVGGSGGGGYATLGAAGGGLAGAGVGGGLGGQSFANPALVPLRGGCPGGGNGSGGGAVQLVSRERIELLAHASINAGGTGGDSSQDYVAGGGSGGGVLLEAPVVMLDAAAGVAANGGGGGPGGAPGAVSTSPAAGGQCPPNSSTYCGNGGHGGAVNAAPQAGGGIDQLSTYQTGGGGGGSVGYIRINTGDGTYTNASDAIESPAPSTAKLKTR